MSYLGVNLASTQDGKLLRDGGAALLSGEGRPLIAIAEERLTRVKHAGGARRSLKYCLDAAGIRRSEVELCVTTSCCEPIRVPQSLGELAEAGFPVEATGHHEAHAYSAFWPSRFDEALVIVMDCGGNTLESNGAGKWWAHGREQVTYYVGRGSDLEVIGRDFDAPFALGFGEVYRAVTHFLGWPSSTFAGNTMALSALGDGKLGGRPIWVREAGKLAALVDIVDPRDPLRLTMNLLQAAGIREVPPRRRDEPLSAVHQNVARWLQMSFNDALRCSVEALVRRTGVRKACFAGGVALNCVAIGQLLRDGVLDEVFVQPAAGDTGQCLGAAFVAFRRCGGLRSASDKGFDPFLGREYGDRDRKDALEHILQSGTGVSIVESPGAVGLVARQIAEGKVVAWFAGRSEFGPRALGGRSIIADPRSLAVKDRVAQIKDRAWFLPFAPSILEDAAPSYFENGGSAHMTVAVPVLDAARKRIAGVTHEDGTARVHIVDEKQGSAFSDLLREFGQITGDPILLNTSLNLRGQPIVETPADAADAFLNSSIDCLFLDGTVVVKDVSNSG